MKSVKRTIVRVATYNKRKRTVTLRPKGTEPDHNGCRDVMGDGHTVLGLNMASKADELIKDPYTVIRWLSTIDLIAD